MDFETIAEKAKKILALAEDAGATEGERAAAREALNRLLEKRGLTMESIRPDVRAEVTFTFKTLEERKILKQVVYMLTGQTRNWSYRKGKKKVANLIGYDLTAAEESDVRAGFAFYRKAWADHMAIQMDAFIQTHRLFSERDDSDTHKAPDPEYINRLMKAMQGVGGESWQRPAAQLPATLALPAA